ncbi:MAG TPA: cytochrome b/b6 domain-containing protein [Burkholderiales bacterium]|jgi:cytochrome b|nr:cytochrome b/b6 domain-containing protein [Burkholderiales bacterium]
MKAQDSRNVLETRATNTVWDLPVRVFHWLLVLLVVSQIVTVTIGGNAMEYHALGGYTILTLVLFRILWGFAGGTHARFGDFVRGPKAVARYAHMLIEGTAESHRGHNPLGGWSVVLMLASLLVQAVTGLFANDDVMMEGPLAKHVSDDASAMFTTIHDINAGILLTLISLHILAVLFYLFRRKQNLIGPMFTGRKPIELMDERPPRSGNLWLAALLVVASSSLVYFVVTF